MKQLFFSFKKIVFFFLTFCMGSLSVTAQYSPLDSNYVRDSLLYKTAIPCGTTAAGSTVRFRKNNGGDSMSVPMGLVNVDSVGVVDSGVFDCGVFRVYYQDFNFSPLQGFADQAIVPFNGGTATLGYVRRNTYCAVLSYIQSVIDFSAIPSGEHIRIYMTRSYDAANPSPITNTFVATDALLYNGSTSGIVNGFMWDYAAGPNAGTDPAPGSFHTEITMNFDQLYDPLAQAFYPLVYQEDYSAPFQNCLLDEYGILLHETTHGLGWFSLISFNSAGTPTPAISSPSIFTGIDNSIYVSTVYSGYPGTMYATPYPLSFPTKLLSSFLTINSGTDANSNYWISNAAAPDNLPVYSGDITGSYGLNASYAAHLEDQFCSYSARERICPGDQQEYVMGTFTLQGVQRRTYTKGEIQTLHNIIGYGINSAYTTTINNHPPFATVMAGYPFYGPGVVDPTFPEDIAANITTPLVNNIGSSVNIDLNSGLYGFTDADGDSLSVYPGSLVNFRGAGNGGNNHNCLTLSNNGKTIIYTPRANYYGRTQFAFNLYDGKDKGSFVLFTMDVTRGTNVNCTEGDNIVLNGGIEEGSEVRLLGTAASESIPNSQISEDGWHEGKLNAYQFSDSHPYSYLNPVMPSGPVIRNSYINCNGNYATDKSGEYYETFLQSFINWPINGPSNNPNSISGNGGDRYLWFNHSYTYYNLCSDVTACHKYILEFDLVSPNAATSGTLIAGFVSSVNSSNYVAPAYNFSVSYNFATTGTAWQHITVPVFWYCSPTASGILSLWAGNHDLRIDNISLKEDTTAPPPLTVSISPDTLSNCQLVLTASVGNQICTGLQYQWTSTVPGTIVGSTTDSFITVNGGTTATYTCIVTDGINANSSGCRTASAKYIVTSTIPAASASAGGATTFCAGGSVVLSASPTGSSYSYLWLNNGVSTGGTGATFTASTSGNYSVKVTYVPTGCNALSDTIAVTANPLPAISPSASPASVCLGQTTTLTNTCPSCAGPLTYSWSPASGPNAVTSASSSSTSATPATTQTYTLSVTDAHGCVNSGTVTVTVGPVPAPDIHASGATTFCQGNNVLLYTTAGTGYTYQWKLNGTAITGATASTYTASVSGNYTVTVTNSSNCTATSAVISVTVITAPTATLTPDAPDTICTETEAIVLHANTGSGLTYKWLLNGSLISGATGSTYSFSESGLGSTTTYTIKVIVTNSTGCPDTSAGILITVLAGNCGCNKFGTYTFKTISGIKNVSSFVTGQTYYVNGDLTITGSGTMTKTYMAVDDYKSIYIDSNAIDTISIGHIFSCDIMWDGLDLKNAVTHSGRLTLNNGTLIEDAYSAVRMAKPITPASGNIFTADSAIFNRNLISVEIDTYNTSTTLIYPFLIRNTVFTSRQDIASAYNTWASTGTLKAVFANGGNPFLPPFKLNDVSFYLPIVCKVGSPALAAIAPSYVGKTSFDCRGGGAYAGLSIGDGSSARYTNLFDNHNYGIQGYYSNIELANNAFINMDGGGVQVFGGAVGGTLFKSQLKLDSAAVNNQFWSCRYNCVEAHNYYSISGRFAKMVGAHSTHDLIADNSYGYNVQTALDIARVDLSYNTICNLTNGIYYSSTLTGNTAAQNPTCISPTRVVYASFNTIIPNIFGAVTTQYVAQAISINGLLTQYGYTFPAHVDSNKTTAYNGITLSSLSGATALYNTVGVQPLPSKKAQYGISSLNSTYTNIHSNLISGSINPIRGDSLRCGVYGSNNTQMGVSCNEVDSVGAAFKFAGPNSPSKWIGNDMIGDGYGLLLGFKGVIGKQYYKTTDSIIGDHWSGVWTGNWMTYTYGSSQATNSILCVRTPGNTNPPNLYNSASPLGNAYFVGPSATIHTFNTGLDSVCSAAPHVPITSINHTDFEPGVLDMVLYGDDGLAIINTADSPVNKWMEQFALYKIMQVDSVLNSDDNSIVHMNLADSSNLLYEFDSMAQNSRFSYLANIENAISYGYLDSAQTLLDAGMSSNFQSDGTTGVILADYPDADYVVANYTAYYQLMINYLDSTLSTDDSNEIITIANMCPFVEGAVVYQARSLYSAVFNLLPLWDDDSLCGGGRGAKHPHSSNSQGTTPSIQNIVASKQAYSLYPNPNKGSMTVQQKLPDDGAVNAEIWDGEGKCIYKSQLNFIGGKVQLNKTDIVPGLYLLQLRDSKGESYIAKFTVN